MATVAVTDHPFPHLEAARAVLEPAGHDVLEQEPPEEHHDLLALDQVVVTPHVACYSEASLVGLQPKAAEQLRSMLAGERPTYLVNAAALQT